MASSQTKREDKEKEIAIDRTIEVTKDNTNKVLNEARKELPQITAEFHDYQEQNIKAVKEMTSTFLESQKDVATSIQSATARGQQLNTTIAMNWMLWPYSYWANPQQAVEAYSKAASNFADTTIAATRLSNELAVASMEATRAWIQRELNDTKAISRYMMETAHEIETSR
jgi:hypothetical protein